MMLRASSSSAPTPAYPKQAHPSQARPSPHPPHQHLPALKLLITPLNQLLRGVRVMRGHVLPGVPDRQLQALLVSQPGLLLPEGGWSDEGGSRQTHALMQSKHTHTHTHKRSLTRTYTCIVTLKWKLVRPQTHTHTHPEIQACRHCIPTHTHTYTHVHTRTHTLLHVQDQGLVLHPRQALPALHMSSQDKQAQPIRSIMQEECCCC